MGALCSGALSHLPYQLHADTDSSPWLNHIGLRGCGSRAVVRSVTMRSDVASMRQDEAIATSCLGDIKMNALHL